MPIYEYRCNQCGFEKEHLQKLNSQVLTTCPACGADAYVKLISAAGFQLKGSGWYATDFKNGSGKSTPASTPAATESSSSTDAPAAAACGGSCACHPT